MLTLLISATFTFLIGAVYLYVGLRLAQRRVSADAKLAQRMFITWWGALAASSFMTGATLILYTFDVLPMWLYSVIGQVSLAAVVVALLGLLYYLIYLYTGARKVFGWLVGFYALFYISLLGLIQWMGPAAALTDDGWSVLQDPTPELPGAVTWSFLLLLVGPQIGASIAYLRLLGKAQTTTQRYRISLVGGSILIWFGSTILASLGQLDDKLWWQLGSRFLGVIAALVILAAYLPPASLCRRWGLESIQQEKAAPR